MQELASQVNYVTSAGASTILIPKSRVRVGDANNQGDATPADLEWWQGTAYIVTHPGGQFKVNIIHTSGHSENTDGGANGGHVLRITQPDGSFSQDSTLNRVGVANGNVTRQESDITFPNIGVPLDFTRTYNSQSKLTYFNNYEYKDDPQNNIYNPLIIDLNVGLTSGWTHSFSDRLIDAGRHNGTQNSHDLIWYTSTGEYHLFARNNGDTNFLVPAELLVDFAHPGSNTYTITERDGTEFTFDSASLSGNPGQIQARLKQKVDRNGNGFVITYKEPTKDRIDTVEDIHTVGGAIHRKLVFKYENSTNPDLVTSVEKWVPNDAGTATIQIGVWIYEYDTATTHLKSVTAPSDQFIASNSIKVNYTYYDNTKPAKVQGLLHQITEPDGHYTSYDYLGTGRAYRVTRSIDLNGAADDITASTLYSFNFVQNRTEVIDPLNRVETFIHQDNGLVTRQIHPDRSKFDTAWDGKNDSGSSGSLFDKSPFLVSQTTDEVGAIQRFRYFETTGDINGQLFSSESKHFANSTSFITTRYTYVSPGSLALVDSIEVDPPNLDDSYDQFTYLTYDNNGNLTETIDSSHSNSRTDALNNIAQYKYYDSANVGTNTYLIGLVKSKTDPKGTAGNEAVTWRVLADTFAVNTGTLMVKLFNTTSNKFVADAVRIDRIDAAGKVQYTQVIDDSDSVFSFTGTFSSATVNQPKYGGSAKLFNAGGTATWKFEGLEVGTYRISTLWTKGSDQDAFAKYDLTDGTGTTPNQSPLVDQTELPADSGTRFTAYTTEFFYDKAGNVTSTKYEGITQSTSQFDHNGRPTLITDPTGVKSSSTSDILGRQRKAGLADPDNSGPLPELLSTLGYDLRGRVTSTADPLGHVTQTAYNGLGNVVLRTNADLTTVRYEYDNVGNLTAQTDELGRATRFIYDDRNRLIQTIHADGAVEGVRYDGAGRVVDSFDANGNQTTFTYDAAWRLLTTQQPNMTTSPNSKIINAYDNLGRLDTTTDFNGHVTKFEYDKLNRVIQTRVTNAAGGAPGLLTTTEYDANGNVVRTATYGAERLSASTANFGANLAIPDSAADLIDWLDPSNGSYAAARPYVRSVVTVYDTFNRPVQSIYVDGGIDEAHRYSTAMDTQTTDPYQDTTTRTIYDAAGRVRFSVDELSHKTELKYDAYGRLEKTILPEPVQNAVHPTTTLTYDANSNVVVVKDANNQTTTNQYDLFNRVVAMVDAEGNTTRYTYDVAGQLVATINALGHATYSLYDERGRVKLQRLSDPDGALPLSAPVSEYVYDNVGNLISEISPNGSETTYQYDERNRLKKEVTTDVQIRDDSAAVDSDFSVTFGTPQTTSNDDEDFGSDHTDVTGTGVVAPAASWHFGVLAEGTYQISLTWTSDDGLDPNVDVSVGVSDEEQELISLYQRTINQAQDPRGIALDYQGQGRTWQSVIDGIAVPEGGSISVQITGSTLTSKIRADAVMIDRKVERSYAYDDNGNLKSATDTLGNETTYTYDELSRVDTMTQPDPDGSGTLHQNVTDYFYDGFGNAVQVNDLYHPTPTTTTFTRRDFYTFDKQNHKIYQTLANTSDVPITTAYIYDAAGNLSRIFDAWNTTDEVITKYTYDNLNRRVTESLDDVHNVSIDGASPNSRAGGTRHKTENVYDLLGNLTSSTTTINDADPTYSANSASSKSTYEYDRANRLVTQVDDFGVGSNYVNSTTRYAYDGNGNVTTEMDATGRVTSSQYDRLNRLQKTTPPDPDGAGSMVSPTTIYAYDVLGNVARTTNTAGETTQSIYDTLGREIRSYDGNGFETRYEYDSEGNLKAVIDPVGNKTNYTYDFLNRVSTETIYNGSTELPSRYYYYDELGNLRQETDRNGRVRKFTHDTLGRLTKEEWFANTSDTGADTTLSWTYDTLGRVKTQKQVDNGTLTYEESYNYDNLGRVTQHDNFDSTTRVNPRVSEKYQYDWINTSDVASPFRTKYTQSVEDSPGGSFTKDAEVTYSADRLGRVIKIGDAQITTDSGTNTTGINEKAITFSYDTAGRTQTIQRTTPANTSFHFDTSYTYDSTGRLATLTHKRTSQSTTFVSYGYTYDAASRITQINKSFAPSAVFSGATTSESFTFDDAGQLKTGGRDGNANDDTYTYDANGNRTLANGATYSTGANNRVTSDGTYTYTYDDEGNLTKRVGSGTYIFYTWDHRNRLTEVTERAADSPTATVIKQISYRYNNDDLRVRKEIKEPVSSSLVTKDIDNYVYDGDQVVLVLDGKLDGSAVGYLQDRYLYAPGTDQLLSNEKFGGEPWNNSYALYWAALDHEGSVREVLDAGGAVDEHREYDSFGYLKDVRNAAGGSKDFSAIDTAFAFSGREWDNDAGLYYNRARWYSAKLGRFLSEDPLGFAAGDANLYRYAGNDPVNSRDPSGLYEDWGYDSGWGYDFGSWSSDYGFGDWSNSYVGPSSWDFGPSAWQDAGIGYEFGSEGFNSSYYGDWSPSTADMFELPSSFNFVFGSGDGSFNPMSYSLPMGGGMGDGTGGGMGGGFGGYSNFTSFRIDDFFNRANDDLARAYAGLPSQAIPTPAPAQPSYFNRTLDQVVLGEYSQSAPTGFGTVISVAAGLTGADIVADIRDLTSNLTDWQWSWGHVGKTALNAASFLPVVGVLKYADEVIEVVQGSLKNAPKRFGDKIDDLVASAKPSQRDLANLPKKPTPSVPRGTQLAEAAERLGFHKTNFRSHGQPVYTKGKIFITPDVDSHSGGAFKAADSVKALGSKQTRLGTFDENLNRIGD